MALDGPCVPPHQSCKTGEKESTKTSSEQYKKEYTLLTFCTSSNTAGDEVYVGRFAHRKLDKCRMPMIA